MCEPKANVDGYSIWQHHQAGLGDVPTTLWRDLSQPRFCRYCGERRLTFFRSQAHLVPEGLGNKWLFSADECDKCNNLFSRYEAALCASAGPILTIGGTAGKSGRVRQTGRSKGSHNIRHLRDESGSRRLSYQVLSHEKKIEPPLGAAISFAGDMIALRMPAPAENFRPRDAYKALAKIGFSLLPPDQLNHYQMLRKWLLSESDELKFPFLDVGMAVGSLGNAPSIISATLMKRNDDRFRGPSAFVVLCAGSTCWFTDLLSDDLEQAENLLTFGFANFSWVVELGDGRGESARIKYGPCRHFDWSSQEATPTPVQGLSHTVDTAKNCVSITVDWREMRPQQS